MTTSPIVSCVNMTYSVWILVTNYLYNLQVLHSFTRRNLPDGLTDDGVQWALGGAAPGQWLLVQPGLLSSGTGSVSILSA